MMSACYCTKSCQYHIKYPTHVYSDVIQRASYLDLELYSHPWGISALQAWLHHFFCCFDVFRMITMKTWLNAPGVGRRWSRANDSLLFDHDNDDIILPRNWRRDARLSCRGPTGPPLLKHSSIRPLAISAMDPNVEDLQQQELTALRVRFSFGLLFSCL